MLFGALKTKRTATSSNFSRLKTELRKPSEMKKRKVLKFVSKNAP